MKFYQVHVTTDAGESVGYLYARNRVELNRLIDETLRNVGVQTDKPELVEVEPTKDGILRLLRLYASHANNG